MLKIIPVCVALLVATGLDEARAATAYGQLPIAFERNQGQADAAVKFLARGLGYGISLTQDGAVLTLGAAPKQSGKVIQMRLEGADSKARAAGVAALPGVSNYFVGDDPAQWHMHIPNYAKVKYAGVYPGIDLVYYGNQRQLEYDFVVAAGADPAAIALNFKGVDSVSANADGDLVLSTGGAPLVQQKPVIYQYVNGERHVLSGEYVVEGSRVRFKVPSYDHSQPLIIDPVLSYSTYLGGRDFDYGDSIAVDSNGNAYLTGLIYAGERGHGDAFVAKLNRDGSQLLYSTYLGGSGQDLGHGIAVDARGNAYVTGYTRSQDFPTTRGAAQSRCGSPAGQNAFVARLDPYGSLSYSTFLGGSGSDTGQAIAVDANQNAYVTGYTTSKDFPTSSRALQRGLNGLQNVFVTKLNANGSALQYSTLLGGDDYDFGFGIAVDKQGAAYVTGVTYGIFTSTFPTTGNAYQTSYGGGGDAFVSKLGADGSALVYSTFLGGPAADGGRSVALDSSGAAYVTGFTASSAFPITAGAFQTVLNGSEDAFVAKISPDGSGLVYSSFLGGSANDGGYGIAVGGNGSAFVTGFTFSPDFPATAGAIETTNPSGRQPFLAELNPAGTALTYGSYLGGSNGDGAYAVAVDSGDNAYVTGYTNSGDFPVSAKAQDSGLAPGASQDAFVMKIASH